MPQGPHIAVPSFFYGLVQITRRFRRHGHCHCFGVLASLFSKPRCLKMDVFFSRLCVGTNARGHVWGIRRNSVVIEMKFSKRVSGNCIFGFPRTSMLVWRPGCRAAPLRQQNGEGRAEINNLTRKH